MLISAEARALVPNVMSLGSGYDNSTLGGTVYPLPCWFSFTVIDSTFVPVLLIPSLGNPVFESNRVRKTSFSSEPEPALTIKLFEPRILGSVPDKICLSTLKSKLILLYLADASYSSIYQADQSILTTSVYAIHLTVSVVPPLVTE